MRFAITAAPALPIIKPDPWRPRSQRRQVGTRRSVGVGLPRRAAGRREADAPYVNLPRISNLCGPKWRAPEATGQSQRRAAVVGEAYWYAFGCEASGLGSGRA